MEEIVDRTMEQIVPMPKALQEIAERTMEQMIDGQRVYAAGHGRIALQTRILKMEKYETCWPHRCMYMGEEKIMVLLTNPQLQGNQTQKENRREEQLHNVLQLITPEERA